MRDRKSLRPERYRILSHRKLPLAGGDEANMGAREQEAMSGIAHVAGNKCPKHLGTVRAFATWRC